MATFVLVHGSWHGGWCWRDVAAALRACGHAVFAPTLSGCAERFHHAPDRVDLDTHARDIGGLLFHEDLRDAILVAHSYAGLVAQLVMNAAPDRLASVVFLDAYLAAPGGRGFDLWTAERRQEAMQLIAAGDPYRPPLDPARLGIDDPQLAAWVRERLTPHPLATYDVVVPAESAAAARIPRLYVHCTQGPIAPTFRPVVDGVRARGWPVAELAAPHDAMLTHPEALAGLLRQHVVTPAPQHPPAA